MSSNTIENLIWVRELYFPSSRGEAQADPEFELLAHYLAIVGTSLTVGYAWIRRPFFSILPTAGGVMTGVPASISAFVWSFQISDGKNMQPDESFYSPGRLRGWIEKISSATVTLPNRTRVAWVALIVPVTGLVALVSKEHFFWWSTLLGTAALTEAGCIAGFRKGWELLDERQDRTT
jgi:hypothetical protein